MTIEVTGPTTADFSGEPDPVDPDLLDVPSGLRRGTRVRDGVLGYGTAEDAGQGYATVQWENGNRSLAIIDGLTWEGKTVYQAALPDEDANGTPRGKAGYVFPEGHRNAPQTSFHSLTDSGNAKRLVEKHGRMIRYVVEWKEWIVWDGGRWARDTLGSVMQLAKNTAQSIYLEAARCTSESRAGELGNWAKASESERALKAMVSLARTEPGIPVEVSALDTDVWLFNCTNGTLDLRTGELRAPDPADLLTKTSGITYDPDASCPQWESFVSWAAEGRDDLATFIHRALGYSLTGDVSERLVFFLHGTGRNGKSTLLKTVRHVFGDYGLRVAGDTFEKPIRGSGGGSASPHIAQLKSARFVTTSELEDGTELAAAMLKDVTGDESVAARELYKMPFEFYPEFKPWIAANHRPKVSAEDQAIWDRLRLIPFDARVSDEDLDPLLGDKLKAEASGILAWAVRGCLAWQQHGLAAPPEVVDASQEYRESMDVFTEFLTYITGAEEDGMPVDFSPTSLRDTYNLWAKREGLDRLSQRSFRAHMEQHGWMIARSTTSRMWKPPERPVTKIDYGQLVLMADAE